MLVAGAFVSTLSVGGVWSASRKPDAYRMLTPAEAHKLLHTENERHSRIRSGTEFFRDAKHVGSATCATCHFERHQEWKRTWHSKMEQWPTEETVVADFNDTMVTYKDVKVLDLKGNDVPGKKATYSVKAHKKDGKFYMTVLGIDDPADDQTYEIAKALGGKWDQHFEVAVGPNFAVAPVRWAVGVKEWINNAYRPYDWTLWDGTKVRPRKPDELLTHRFAEAKCTGCHTTGYAFEKDAKTGRWGVKGSGELGIACEHCHGPGSKHVEEATAAQAAGMTLVSGTSTIAHPLKDFTFEQQNQMCGKCHGRQASREHPDQAFQQRFMPGDTDLAHKARFWSWWSPNKEEQAYFWPNDLAKRNRQQWQDFQKSTHFNKGGLTCITCHVFHGDFQDGQLRIKTGELCAACHGPKGLSGRNIIDFYKGSKMEMAGVQCADCHMPKSAFRTNSTSKFSRQWHGTLHSFKTVTPADELQHGTRSSCTACHIDTKDMPGSVQVHLTKDPPFTLLDELDAVVKDRQRAIKKRILDTQALLARVDADNSRAARLSQFARAKMQIVVIDGSLGIHNYPKAQRLLRQAHLFASVASGVEPALAGAKAAEAETAPPASDVKNVAIQVP